MVSKMIKRLDKGKSPGPSGWRNEHFQKMVKDEVLLSLITSVVNLISSGCVDGGARDGVLAARLVGGPKPNDGVRPIAMGGTLMKIVEK